MKRKFTVLFILFVNCIVLYAQPVLVKSLSSSSENFISAGNDVFYTSGDSLIKVYDSSGNSVVVAKGLKNPSQLTNVNGILYFVSNQICSGYSCTWKELWRSDGTSGGTHVVKYFKSVSIINHINNTVFLAADEYANGLELWRTDGTIEGTALIKDINTGPEGSLDYYESFWANVYNNHLYFSANDNVHGKEVWVSDGTTHGTALFRDIQPGPKSSDPAKFTVSGTNLYFSTINSDVPDAPDVLYNKLWKINGPALTLMKDFGPHYDFSIDKLIDVNGTLFFTTAFLYELPYATEELWKSNAAPWNTVLVKEFFDYVYWYDLINVDGILVAAASSDDTGGYLYRSNGTADGTYLFWRTDNYDQTIEMASINNILLFNAVPPTPDIYLAYNENVDLWRSDLTKEGTSLVKDLYPDLKLSYDGVRNLINANNTLYFTSDDNPDYNYFSQPRSLWKYKPEPFVVDNFILVNTQSGMDMRSLKMQDTVYTDQKVTVKALTSGLPGSVKFFINDVSQGADNVKPYTLAGDYNGEYFEWKKKEGLYKISAIPFSGGNGTGTPGNTFIRYVYVLAPEDTVKNAPMVAASPISLVVNAYPNPISDKLSIDCSSGSQQNISIQLLDYFGNKCFSQAYLLPEGSTSIPMDFNSTNLKSGFYFLKIISERDGERTLKIYKY